MTTTAGKLTVPEKTTPGDKRRALGRGLDSLLPAGPRVVAGTAVPVVPPTAAAAVHPSTIVPDVQPQAARAPRPPDGESVVELPLDLIDKNPYQTRSRIGEHELQELAESIQANGVIQPIVVRPASNNDGRYVLITGERRTRASKLAGKEKIPAIVRQVSDQQAAEMTIVENLQRADLNCMDQAEAFARLSQEFGLTQEQIGKRTGCERSTVANYMRLLKLPGEVQFMLREGQLDFSHARVLLTLQNPEHIVKVAKQALEKHLSVDQLESLVIRINYPVQGQQPQAGRAQWVDPNVRAAQEELERLLGVRVQIKDRRGKGKIVIEYATLEDFDRVVQMLKGKAQ